MAGRRSGVGPQGRSGYRSGPFWRLVARVVDPQSAYLSRGERRLHAPAVRPGAATPGVAVARSDGTNRPLSPEEEAELRALHAQASTPRGQQRRSAESVARELRTRDAAVIQEIADAVRAGHRVEREVRGVRLTAELKRFWHGDHVLSLTARTSTGGRGSGARIPRRRPEVVEEYVVDLLARCLADRERH